MAGVWGNTKTYSSYLKEIATAGGVLGGGAAATGAMGTTTAVTTAGGIAGTTFIKTTVSVGAAGIALAAAGGTAFGQVVNFFTTFVWDPVAPVYAIRDLRHEKKVKKPEVDLFLYDLGTILGIPFNGVPPGTPHETAGFVGASVEFVRVAVRLFINLARGAEAATRGDKGSLTAYVIEAGRDLEAYIQAIKETAGEAKSPEVARFLSPLSKRTYLQFIDDCRNQGQQALPAVEGLLFQRLLFAAGVTMDSPDFRDDMAAWVAEGPEKLEIAAFDASESGALTYAELLSGSIDWYWSRIKLSESPLFK